MPSRKIVEDTIAKLKIALKSGDAGKQYDAMALADRVFSAAIPAIGDCLEEAQMYSGTTERNTEIILKLLEDRYNKPDNGITNIEKGLFAKLYNRDGYVLNFTTNDFDVFTLESVGVAVCQRYNMSKGKSLIAFIHEADEDLVIKLLLDLFDYYEANYTREYKKLEENAPYYTGYSEEYSLLYRKCKAVVNRLRGIDMPLSVVAEELKDRFSTDYMNHQFELMLSMCDENPTEAIGKAKELIESCCITILDGYKVARNKDWDVGQLAGEVVKLLRLTPQNVPEDTPLAGEIKAILGNLRAIATNIAKLRNAYGSGHGKTASYKGLEKRHARLAVGSSITLVEFLWTSYERSLG